MELGDRRRKKEKCLCMMIGDDRVRENIIETQCPKRVRHGCVVYVDH